MSKLNTITSDVKKKIVCDSLTVTTATVIDKLIFFLINVLVARYCAVPEFGIYTTALAFATFFSQFSNIGISQSLKRAVSLDSAHDSEHFTTTLITKTVLAIATYCALVTALYYTDYCSETVKLSLIFGLIRIGNEYLSTYYAFYEAKERFTLVSFLKIGFAVSFISSAIIVVLLKYNYFYFAYYRLYIVIAYIIILFIITIRQTAFSIKLSTIPGFFHHTFFFGLSTIFGNLYNKLNIMIISFIKGTSLTGFFNNGFMFYNVLSFIPINFGKIVLPFLYREFEAGRMDSFRKVYNAFTKALAVLSFGIMIIFYSYAGQIIPAVYGDKYSESIIILQITSFGIPFMFTISGVLITGLDRQNVRSLIQGSALVTFIIINIILIYTFSIQGAAAASVINAVFLFCFYHGYLVRKKIIGIRSFLPVYVKLTIISAAIILLERFIFPDLNPFLSIIIAFFIYCTGVVGIVVEKNDINLVKKIITGE